MFKITKKGKQAVKEFCVEADQHPDQWLDKKGFDPETKSWRPKPVKCFNCPFRKGMNYMPNDAPEQWARILRGLENGLPFYCHLHTNAEATPGEEPSWTQEWRACRGGIEYRQKLDPNKFPNGALPKPTPITIKGKPTPRKHACKPER